VGVEKVTVTGGHVADPVVHGCIGDPTEIVPTKVYCPVPTKVTVCGLPPPASVTDTAADARPLAAGVKVTVIVQVLLAGTLDPQVFVSGKSTGSVPVTAILTAKADLEEFLNVATCGLLDCPTATDPKLMSAGDSVTTVPVPLRATDCGLPVALSVIVTAPVRVFGIVGLKVMVIVQFAPTATLVPQVLVSVKSPDGAICVIVSVALPTLVSVTVCALLCVPTSVSGNVRLVAESCTAGPVPIPNPVKLTN
jgi:hypothetical protein